MSDSGDRDQEPTPLRLQQARAAGDAPNSSELAAILSILGALAAGYLTFQQIAGWLQRSTIGLWSNVTLHQSSTSELIGSVQAFVFEMVGVLLPFSAMLIFAGVAATWLQTGPVWLPNKMVPSLANLGPRRWRQQLRPSNLLSVTGMGLPKIAIGLTAMSWSMWCHREALLSLGNATADLMVGQLFNVVLTVCLYTALTLAILGLLDYGIQWLGYQRRMQMSHQEIREEQRHQGGAHSVNRSRRGQRI